MENILNLKKSKYSTCPSYLSADPYDGCSHECIYCVALYSKEVDVFYQNPSVVENFVEKLDRELDKKNRNGEKKVPIYLSPWTDPYQAIEDKTRITREVIKTIIKHNYPFFIVTKSDLILNDLDLLKDKNAKCNICFSIISPNEEIRRRFERGASRMEDRFNAIQELTRNNIRTIIKIDPVIPGVTDKKEDFQEIIRKGFEAGIYHITSEILRLTPGLLENMKRNGLQKSEIEWFEELYINKGYQKDGSIYIPDEKKYEILSMIWEICKIYNLPFTTCKRTAV